MKKTYGIIWLISFILCFTLTLACAFDDGFGSTPKIKSKYFNIYYSSQADPENLARKLNTGMARQGQPQAKHGSGLELGSMADALFLEVCDILGTPLYSFRGTIKICRTKAELSRICNSLPGQEDVLHEKPVSFCSFELDTIYVSEEDFSRHILGHEIAHALINRYFTVPPPEKTAEILSSYVEYQLRKTDR